MAKQTKKVAPKTEEEYPEFTFDAAQLERDLNEARQMTGPRFKADFWKNKLLQANRYVTRTGKDCKAYGDAAYAEMLRQDEIAKKGN